MDSRSIKAVRELIYVNRMQAEIIDGLFDELCLREGAEDIGGAKYKEDEE